MSLEQFKAFLERVKGDTSLQERLKAAADHDAVAAIAKEEGFIISTENIQDSQIELTEEELDNMAGSSPCTMCLISETFENAKTVCLNPPHASK